ncbi:MAG: hypothetical protein JXB05_15210 [Myxococcaceae bacterium]|nr:hypothetical protein [Myxococcaceae bacterium]
MVVVFALLTGCGIRPAELSLGGGSFAVGSRAELGPVARCPGPQREGIPCAEEHLELVSATVDDPTVFELLPQSEWRGPTRLAFRVLREGTTQLEVVVRRADGREERLSAELVARVAKEVLVGPSCSLGASPKPLYLPPAFETRVDVDFFDDGSIPLRGLDFMPVDFGALEVLGIDPNSSGGARVTLRTPAEATSTAITSPVDPTFVEQVEVYDFAQVNGLALEGPAAIRVGSYDPVHVLSSIDGTRACQEGTRPWEHEVTIVTPTLCSLSADGAESQGTRSFKFYVYGLAPGTCRISATLSGTSLSGNVELPIEAR